MGLSSISGGAHKAGLTEGYGRRIPTADGSEAGTSTGRMAPVRHPNEVPKDNRRVKSPEHSGEYVRETQCKGSVLAYSVGCVLANKCELWRAV